MDEFIVWDDDRKIWIDESYPFFINSSGLLCIQRNDKQMILESDCKAFFPIGKTDINGKKIYTESSIVEFIFSKDYIVIGWLHYNLEKLLYEINIIEAKALEDSYKIDSLHQTMFYDKYNMDEFKIIDTIQENKLGFIK